MRFPVELVKERDLSCVSCRVPLSFPHRDLTPDERLLVPDSGGCLELVRNVLECWLLAKSGVRQDTSFILFVVILSHAV